MSTRKIYITLIAILLAGVFQLSTSLVLANDTTEVAYEISSVCDTLILADSIIVIHTVCAPICSSRARVYNKVWEEIGVLRPPFSSAFPEAYIEDDKVLWRDNDNFDYTPQ